MEITWAWLQTRSLFSGEAAGQTSCVHPSPSLDTRTLADAASWSVHSSGDQRRVLRPWEGSWFTQQRLALSTDPGPGIYLSIPTCPGLPLSLFFQEDSVWIHTPHITELGLKSSLGRGGETAGPGREPDWQPWREKQGISVQGAWPSPCTALGWGILPVPSLE